VLCQSKLSHLIAVLKDNIYSGTLEELIMAKVSTLAGVLTQVETETLVSLDMGKKQIGNKWLRTNHDGILR
jgi:hypothetical protein